MRKVVKFVNKKKGGELIEKYGVQYRRVDMGGYKVDIRVKPQDELTKDIKLFGQAKK